MIPIQHSVKSDWLLNAQSRVLQADWLVLENNEKATLNIRSSMSKAREAADQIMARLVALVSIHCAILKTNYGKTSILKSAAMMAKKSTNTHM